MSKSIHAHKILKQLSNTAMSKDELQSWCLSEFGDNATFKTCIQEGFSFEGIVQFFLEQQKVTVVANKMSANHANLCFSN